MKAVTLGSSSHAVAAIGLGTFQFSGSAEDLRAIESDVPILVDTSSLYHTEEVVGEAARGHRDHFFVATKVFPDCYHDGDLQRSARESLGRLGLNYIDLLQLHWPDGSVPIAETIGAMEDLVDEGLVRMIGVCNFTAPELRDALAACRRHTLVSNQFSYSLYDRRFENDIVPFCDGAGVTVIAYSPLGANGMDFLRGRDRDGALASVAARHGATEAQIALAWVLDGGKRIAIPKSSSPERMVENSRAAEIELSADDRRALEASVQPRRIRGRLEERARYIVRRSLYTQAGELNMPGRMVSKGRDLVGTVKRKLR